MPARTMTRLGGRAASVFRRPELAGPLPPPIWVPARPSAWVLRFRFWPADDYGLRQDVLECQFRTGNYVHYLGVSYGMFRSLSAAGSVGTRVWDLLLVRGKGNKGKTKLPSVAGPFKGG